MAGVQKSLCLIDRNTVCLVRSIHSESLYVRVKESEGDSRVHFVYAASLNCTLHLPHCCTTSQSGYTHIHTREQI